jgi:dolichyl-phosphate beta-glucosyltransferase
MKINQLSLSIVIPCYNEENNLNRGVLDQVYNYLRKQKYTWEVIIANDGSTDQSLEIVKDFANKHKGFIVLDLPHGGKPSALKGGLVQVKNDIVLFTDMDQSTPITELDKLLPYFDQNYQIVIGSRGTQRSKYSLIRQIASATFLTVRRLILLPSIVDTQCGFKAFETEVAKKVFPLLAYFQDRADQSGWTVSAYDVEFLFIAHKFGNKIKEVRVKWRDEDTSTTKNRGDKFKKESIQMAKEIYRIKLKDMKGGYASNKRKLS